MTFSKSNCARLLLMLVLAISLTTLTACGPKPTDVRPQRDADPLPAKPVALMVVIPDPGPPTPLKGLPAKEQARVAVADYTGIARWAAELDRQREALIQWVERLYTPANEGRSDDDPKPNDPKP